MSKTTLNHSTLVAYCQKSDSAYIISSIYLFIMDVSILGFPDFRSTLCEKQPGKNNIKKYSV